MRVFRIADGRHPLWDGTGAALVGGRWNSPGQPLIYASLSYACAMLETLAHAGIGRIPTTHRFVIGDLPDNVDCERHAAGALPSGWDREGSQAARRFGDQWIAEHRSVVLLVPSVVAKLEWNALINPLHPDFSQFAVSPPEAVIWDRRLFAGRLRT